MKNKIYSIYSEYTPNPEVMKFVSNQILTEEMIEFENIPKKNEYPLIYDLFLFPFVENIFLGINFISIEKNNKVEWDDFSFEIRVMIQDKLNTGVLISNNPKTSKKKKIKINRKRTKKEALIEEVFEQQIRPYVMQDGGDISLISYEKGIVKVLLQGACNGCPSSTYTLKQGIQKKLKEIIGDEIKEVIPIN
jgi:Fe-S cluster biogenesis protein NfuA